MFVNNCLSSSVDEKAFVAQEEMKGLDKSTAAQLHNLLKFVNDNRAHPTESVECVVF